MFRILTRQVTGLLIAGALASFAVAPAHAGTLTLSGVSCTSLVVGGSASQGWTVSCTSMTCQLQASNPNPAPGTSITLTTNCDSGANGYVYATTAGGCAAPNGTGTQVTVSESAAKNCTYQVTGTNSTNGVQGQATTAVNWSIGTPAAPTGCTESADQTSFPAAGGTINLSASCQSPASGIVWSWTRNGAGGWSATQNPTEALPANGTSSAVAYTYQAKACNGTDSFGGQNCTIITPQISASVAAGGGGGGGAISCAGVQGLGPQASGNTAVVDSDWSNPGRVILSIGQNDTGVIRFTPTQNSNGIYVHIGGAEFGSQASARYITLSTQACDFRPSGAGLLGANAASSFVFFFSVGPNNSFGYYPALTPGTTYFINIQTSPGNCTGTCNMFADLVKGGAP